MSTGLLATGAEHGTLAAELADRGRAFRAALADRFCGFVAADEANALARTVTARLQGIAVQAREEQQPTTSRRSRAR